jgi:hypothetical protein
VNKFRTGCCCALVWLWAVAPCRAQEPAPPPPQEPPAEQAGAQTHPLIQQPPPLPPRLPDVRMPGETGWFVGVNAWFPTQKPVFDKGRGSSFADPSRVTMQGKPKLADGLELGIAAGAHNTLRFSYFQTSAAGDFTTNKEITLLGQVYDSGTLLSSNYRLKAGKLSFDYLTWPFPVESRRFRLRTLWQIHYVSYQSGFDAPLLPLVDDTGTALTDSNGNALSYAVKHSHWFVSPAVGLGLTHYVTRHFRLDASASGFAFPHRMALGDGEATANFRVGRFELRVGGKGFYFKTSPRQEYYGHGKLGSAFVGVRWYSE